MKAIILVAGRGTRLAPLTDTVHKSLIEVGGQTILKRQITQLVACGIHHIVLVTGHRENDLRDALVHFQDCGAQITLARNSEFADTNTAYSLGTALKLGEGAFLLLDGDVVMEDALLQKLIKTGPDNLLCETDPSKLHTEAVKAVVDKSGVITTIGKNIINSHAIGESIGVGFFSAAWSAALHEDCMKLQTDKNHWNWYYEDVIAERLRSGKAPAPLHIITTGKELWVEIDDAKDLATARKLFSSY